MGWIPLPMKWAHFYRALARGELLLGTQAWPRIVLLRWGAEETLRREPWRISGHHDLVIFGWCVLVHIYLTCISSHHFLRYDPQVLTGWWFQHVSRCFNHFHAIATPQKDRKGLDTWKLWRKHHLYHPGNLRIAIGLVSIAREIGWRFSMTPGSLRRRCMPRASEERPDGNCPTTGVKGGFSKWWAPQTSNPFQPIHC